MIFQISMILKYKTIIVFEYVDHYKKIPRLRRFAFP